ncbi:hypothetical protein TWF694_010865 [Orbilia ellipsospora]|uniref:N-acetyltransferase domain-containing protein n=1 Tax=Orbilia ellipsospora TaxID=2528407 RepID=A0AAV9X8G5_9PEZI
MSLLQFQSYWFSNYAAIMLRGRDETLLREGRDWDADCVGTFVVFPRYPGRSAHICSGQFFICDKYRGKGAGKVLISTYLDHATKLGYTSTLFDLIYETNEPMLHILDNQGFKRIGVIKSAAIGASDPVDSIILSRDLVEEEDFQSNERFEKIRYYLEKGKYPPSATRSEKSRLRSAATHYRLTGNKLMLKDKEVISDPQKQYEIARDLHKINHGGINKTTAQIADKYHWIQIKRTVSQVLKNCVECTQNARPPVVKAASSIDRGKEDMATLTSAARRLAEENSNSNMERNPGDIIANDTVDADAEVDDEAVLTIPAMPAPDPMLDIPSPISAHHHLHHNPAAAVLLDHPHRSIKSPPGHHHHQLAQSIRSQHDAMSLSQRPPTAVENAIALMSRQNLLSAAGIPENIAVDPAAMADVVRHLQAFHHPQAPPQLPHPHQLPHPQSQHHTHPHSHTHPQVPHHHHRHDQHHHHEAEDPTIDDINIMDNFDDIPQFELIGSPTPHVPGEVIGIDEEGDGRHHDARDSALIAVAAMGGAVVPPGSAVGVVRGVNVVQGPDDGDGDVVLGPFG